MNLKISQDLMTFKISEDELKDLLCGKSFENKIKIGMNNFNLIIKSNNCEQTFINFELDKSIACLTFDITINDIKKLSDMGKNRDGMFFKIDELNICLQVDIRKNNKNT